MQVTVKKDDDLIWIQSAGETSVGDAFHRFLQAGAKPDWYPVFDRDDETWFAVVRVPTEPEKLAQVEALLEEYGREAPASANGVPASL